MSDECRQLLAPFVVSEDQVQKIEDSVAVYLNLVFSGQSHTWIGPPNGGKTAMAMAASAAMAKAGLQVYYCQLDTAGSALKAQFEHADKNNYYLIAPLGDGHTDATVVDAVRKTFQLKNQSNTVLVLDTGKKFFDVNSKSSVKEFLGLGRKFTRAGGTLIILGHSNKHKNPEGKIIVDGVGDVVADVDNVAILEGFHTPDVLEITTNHSPDAGGKSRARIEEVTFQLDKHRYEIKPLTGMTLEETLSRDEQELKDEPIIKAIKELLIKGEPVNQSTLVHNLQICGISQRPARRVLLNTHYHDYHWRVERGVNNAWLYTAIPVKAAKTVKTSVSPDVNTVPF